MSAVDSDAPADERITALERELADTSRALWLVINAAGGSVTISQHAQEEFDSSRAVLMCDVSREAMTIRVARDLIP